MRVWRGGETEEQQPCWPRDSVEESGGPVSGWHPCGAQQCLPRVQRMAQSWVDTMERLCPVCQACTIIMMAEFQKQNSALGNYGARCNAEEKVRGWHKCCVPSGHRGTGRTQANSSLLAPENAPVTHQAQCTFSSWLDSWGAGAVR